MSYTSPKAKFGLKQVTFINRTTGLPYGKPLRVLQSSNLTATAETIKNEGGASGTPWNTQAGATEATLTIAYSEDCAYMINVTTGAATKNRTAQITANGNLPLTLAATGTLQDGTYVIRADTTSSVSIYAVTADESVATNDAGLVVSGVSVSTTPFQVDAIGVSLSVTSGTTLTVGQTDQINIMTKPAGYSAEVKRIDAPYVEIHAVTEEGSTIICHKAQAQGMPMNNERKAYQATELTFTLSQDSGKPIYTIQNNPVA